MSAMEMTEQEQIAKLRAHLRIGLPVACAAGSFVAIETLSEARFAHMQNKGGLSVVISKQRALDLYLSHDPSRDAVLKLPRDYPFEKLRALADPALDLDYPGKGPLAQAQLPSNWADWILQLCRSARLLPAALITSEHFEDAEQYSSKLAESLQTMAPSLQSVSKARVPLEIAGASQLHVFRSLDDDLEHYAIIVGAPDPKAPMVRLHSACFTGDCLGSLKCDCGPQLHKSLEILRDQGGILLYLSQEGRGIGLANKIRAYQLQDQGYDTVEANHRLGFADDERDFRIGAELLKLLKIDKLQLLTNNPRKITWLENAGLKVTKRLPLNMPPRPENAAYLRIKRDKSGHLL